MKRQTQKPVPCLRLDLAILLPALVVTMLFYRWFDPAEMRTYGVFPWDAGIYLKLAMELPTWTPPETLNAMYPWGPRILFPATYGSLAHATGWSLVQSAYVVNALAVLAVSGITFAYWRRNGVGRALAWAGIGLFALGSNYPLRYSGIFPGGGFAFEMLTVWMLYFGLVSTRRPVVWRMMLAVVAVFSASLSREFSTYVIAGVLFLRLLVGLPRTRSIDRGRRPFLSAVFGRLRSRSFGALATLLLVSIIGYELARALVQDPNGSYSIVWTAIDFGWFHLNVAEFAYPFFYALGPFVVALILAFVFTKTRQGLSRGLLAKVRNVDLVVVLCAFGVLFAVFGGTDSDRFLAWMFPFFGLLGLSACTQLAVSGDRRTTYSLAALFVVGLTWSRFYVPAVPHLFFPGRLYCAQANVRTNYDPELFWGPPLMSSVRQPLQAVPRSDALGDSDIPIADRQWLGPSPQVPVSTGQATCRGTPYEGAYRWNANDIPFPFGFAHNQYELLVAHPSHGWWKVRAILLGQWVVLLAVLVAANRKSLSREQHSNPTSEDA